MDGLPNNDTYLARAAPKLLQKRAEIAITMTLSEFLILLIIAAICGGVGQALAGFSLGGCFVSIIVGFIGAYIGLWIAGKLGLPEFFAITVGGKTFPVVWAVIGSAVLTLIIAVIRRGIYGGNRL